MKQRTISLIVLSTTATVLACGPAPADSASGSASGSGSDSDTDSDSDSDSETDSVSVSDSDSATTSPPVTECQYEGQIYEDGEEFDTADGCITYQCVTGVLAIVSDDLVTIPGDLDLATQEDVDAQTCLGVVEGALTISGTAVDMTPLGHLTRVGGALDITATDAVDIQGFGSLNEVGAGIVIADNANLVGMGFLPYMSVFGDVTIQNNDMLTSLAGAEFIGQCGNCSHAPSGLDDGEATTGGSDQDPGGEDSGAEPENPGGTFYGNVLILDNDALRDVSAMSNLVFAWADVRLRNNIVLDDISPLQLSEVRGDLEISSNASLATTTVQAFLDVVDVWGLEMNCGNLDGTPCA